MADPSSWYVDTVGVRRRTGIKKTTAAKGEPILSAARSLVCRVERGDFSFTDTAGDEIASDARIHTSADALADAGLTELRAGRDWITLPDEADATNLREVLRVDRASTKDGGVTTFEILIG